MAAECARVDVLRHREVLAASLALLLAHAQRFYHRQFETRRGADNDLLVAFERRLTDYFSPAVASPERLPNVGDFAGPAGLSTRYFADLIKQHTGRTVTEHMHAEVMAAAKRRLLASDATVAEVAYALGFAYPQYFSRLFKSRVGVSPTEWRGRALGADR